MNKWLKLTLSTLACLLASQTFAKTDILLRGAYVTKESTPSFQQKGISHQRYEDSGFHLSQAVLASSFSLSDDWSAEGVLNAYNDGEEEFGFTQLFIKYRPLTASSIKPEVKLGAFYPSISAENTDFGWLSPHFLSNSAINSWIGEELRIGGIEVSLRQSGRQVKSNWSWKVVGSVFKGNDSTGTLISWRGFALHDRQSVYDDRVNFLPIPGVVDDDKLNAPAWTDPFREIDGRAGYYIGAHLSHKRTAEVKYYFYDNNADQTILDPDRIYAWHTRFHSLTMRYLPSRELTLFSQILVGDTLMGDGFVDNDFASAYIAAAYTYEKATFSARADWYQVIDRDNTMYDPNNSDGYALTVSTRYQIHENVAITAEWQTNKGEQDNLTFFQSNNKYTENVFQVALTIQL